MGAPAPCLSGQPPPRESDTEQPRGTRAGGGSRGQKVGVGPAGPRAKDRPARSEPGAQVSLSRAAFEARAVPQEGPGGLASLWRFHVCWPERGPPSLTRRNHLRGCFVLIIRDQSQVPLGWESPGGPREPAGSQEGLLWAMGPFPSLPPAPWCLAQRPHPELLAGAARAQGPLPWGLADFRLRPHRERAQQ